MRVLILFQTTGGGTNVLLQKAAGWLEATGHEVVGPDDPRMSQRVDLVLLPTSEMHRISHLMRAGPRFDRILVWAMGSRAFHGAFYDQMNRSRAFGIAMYPWRLLCRQLMKAVLSHRSVVFTDEVGMNSDIRFPAQVSTADLIHPIAIRAPVDRSDAMRLPSNPRRFAWLGRIDHDFKVLPLLRIVRDVSAHCQSHDEGASFLVIGSGNADELLRREIRLHPHIRFNWLPRVANDELEDVLLRETDVLFAMGTSALEGARVGIPTVLIQPFTQGEQEPSHPYRWIGTTDGHSLGEFAWAEYPPRQPKLLFENLWGEPLQERSRQSFAFSRKFELEQVFPRLFDRPLPSPMNVSLRALLAVHALQRAGKQFVRGGLVRLGLKQA
jgi:hypothetical protein